MGARRSPRRVVAIARISVIAMALSVASCASVDGRYVAEEQFDHRGRRRHVQPALTMEYAARGTRAEHEVVVTSPWLPGTEISGIAETRSDGGLTVYVTRARLFANWSNGWTEAIYEASGILSVERSASAGAESSYALSVDEPVEFWTLEAGAIRYYDTYLLDDDGLSRVRARVDRLTEVAHWMQDRGGPDAYGSDDRAGRYGDPMADEVRRAVRAEIDAGTAPEWLVTLDASRSLERDLREASRMLVALYNLDHFNGELAGTLTLREQ